MSQVQKMSNGCGDFTLNDFCDIAVYEFFKMAAICHLWFV